MGQALLRYLRPRRSYRGYIRTGPQIYYSRVLLDLPTGLRPWAHRRHHLGAPHLHLNGSASAFVAPRANCAYSTQSPLSPSPSASSSTPETTRFSMALAAFCARWSSAFASSSSIRASAETLWSSWSSRTYFWGFCWAASFFTLITKGPLTERR